MLSPSSQFCSMNRQILYGSLGLFEVIVPFLHHVMVETAAESWEPRFNVATNQNAQELAILVLGHV